MRHHLALATLLAFSGSIAHAAPTKKKEVEADEEIEVVVRKRKKDVRPEKVALRGKDKPSAAAAVDDDDDKVTRPAKRKTDGDGDAARKARRATEDDADGTVTRPARRKNAVRPASEGSDDDQVRPAKRKSAVRRATDETSDDSQRKRTARRATDETNDDTQRKRTARRATEETSDDTQRKRTARRATDETNDDTQRKRRATGDGDGEVRRATGDGDGEVRRASDDDDRATRAARRESAARRSSEDDDVAEVPLRVRRAGRTRARGWNFAFGPYLWASSVDADVSLGPANVSSGVDFLDMQKHAKYGIPLAGEARYGRFSVYADMMYGVIGLDGASTVGPVMVAVDGEVSSLMADGHLGYLVLGGERAPVSIEARVGMRYQRTAISGTLELAGAPLAPPEYIDASSDALAGAHVVVRPTSWLNLSATGDIGVFGASTNTWSALVDANFRVSRRFLLSLGWRTMTNEKANVSIKMHGPRAAVQLLF